MNAITRPAQQAPAVRPVLVPTTFDQLVRFADMAATSGMMPKDYIGKPGAIMIAVQMGSELGLAPMQSLTSIAVINGRPGLYGDGLIGICRQSPLCQDIVETFEGEGEQRKAVCVATRRGASPCTGEFSVADAKRAGLWEKAGPWKQYPDRMLRNRARGFALRDAFPDLLRGLKTVEELRDTPADTYRGTTLDHTPAPPARVATPAAPAIDDAIPERVMQAPPQPKPPEVRASPVRKWLDGLQADLATITDEDALHAIENEDAVKDALRNMRNGDLRELKAMLAEAFERVREVTHDPETGELGDS